MVTLRRRRRHTTATKDKNKDKNKNSAHSSTSSATRKKKNTAAATSTTVAATAAPCSTLQPFEHQIEDVFRRNKLDIVSTGYNLEREIVRGLKQAVNPYNVSPQDDFFSYVNDRWIRDVKLSSDQQYIVQIDNFRLVQHKVYEEMVELLRDFVDGGGDVVDPQDFGGRASVTALRRCMRNAYHSFQRHQSNRVTQQRAAAFQQWLLAQSDMYEVLAYFNRNEIVTWGAPFNWSINPDDKDPTKYVCYLDAPQVTLIDVMVYFPDATDPEEEQQYKRKYKRAYLQYLRQLFEVAFGEEGAKAFDVEDVYRTEEAILNAMGCSVVKVDDEDDNYNEISATEAMAHFQFDWAHFSRLLGCRTVPHRFITSNVNYLLCGTKLLAEKWNTPQWHTYWIYLFIRQMTRWDEHGWRVFYDFHGAFVKGQDAPETVAIRPIFPMAFCFHHFFSTQYVQRYTNPAVVQYVQTMAEDLKIVFQRIVQRNRWMQPSTKAKALQKLHHLKMRIGVAPPSMPDPLLPYDEDDPWENLGRMAQWRHQFAADHVDKPVVDIQVIDWTQIPPKFVGTQPYVVNAFYTPTQNQIYIPLGYLQKPFVDLGERGLEYNLSHVGYTIAHELSHALDDWGSKYDERGRLHDWWTPKDKRKFKQIQRDVIRQYQEVAKRDGIDFDAAPTIGEDLADISGFAICQEYLRDFQLKNEDILPIQSLSFEAFFIYFAVQSRQKISKKAIQAQLKTNPHPLDKYRCNVPLSRSSVFRAIYNVAPRDPMSWHSTNQVWN